MLTLTEEESTFLKLNLQPTNSARVGDYLVECQTNHAICEDRYADGPDRVRYTSNTLYILRRITKITKNSFYTRAEPGMPYNGGYYIRWNGGLGCMTPSYPPPAYFGYRIIMCPRILQDHVVRDICKGRDLAFDITFREIDRVNCLNYNLQTFTAPKSCTAWCSVFYTTPSSGIHAGYCENCWDDRLDLE